MKQPPQPIVCGSIAIDRIMNFLGSYKDLIKPQKVHVLSLSVLLDGLKDTPGGVGANIAYNLALLGENSILLGSVGKDADSYMSRLAKLGVDTDNVHTSHLATASFNVITDNEDNQVGGFYPGAMADAKTLSLAKWKGQDVFVTVSAHDPTAMRRQVEECRKLGLRLFYDPGQQVANVAAADLKAGIKAAEIMILNDYELSLLCDRTGLTEAQLKAQVPVVITTFGSKGSATAGNSIKKIFKISAAKPAVVVDPTGAGDGYRAGFLYGYLRQWDIQTCARLGATVAAFAVEHHGTQEHHFSKQAVAESYHQNFKEQLKL